MPLLCDDLASVTVSALNALIKTLNPSNPLHKDWMNVDTTVFEEAGCAIFKSATGIYFRRIQSDIASEILADIREGREYLCSAFEVDKNDPTVIQKLRDRFQENHGQKMARMIDDCVISHGGKQLMLVKFPSCVVRHMLMSSGGLLKTGFSGKKENLAQIPTLVRFGQIPESGENDDQIKSMIVTQYKENQYHAARSVHSDILREVLARPNLGITLSPFAVWDS